MAAILVDVAAVVVNILVVVMDGSNRLTSLGYEA